MSFFETKQKQPQATVTLISGMRGPVVFLYKSRQLKPAEHFPKQKKHFFTNPAN